MRTPATVTVGLLASAVLLLGACGGSDDDDAATFCTDGQALFDGLGDRLDAAGPAELGGVLEDAVSGLDGLTPPEEIAEPYGMVRDAYDQLAEVAGGLDLSTEAGATEFSAAAEGLGDDVEGAESQVDDWVEANCEDAA